MTTGRLQAPSAEPNLTPMIDVLLVLLIVFMVAAIRVRLDDRRTVAGGVCQRMRGHTADRP